MWQSIFCSTDHLTRVQLLVFKIEIILRGEWPFKGYLSVKFEGSGIEMLIVTAK